MSHVVTASSLSRPDAVVYRPVAHYIGGSFVEGRGPYLDVNDPSTGRVISQVPLGGTADVDRAVRAASMAFPAWAATPAKDRAQVFYRYKALLERDLKHLAALISLEHGKVAAEAEAEILKAIETVEFACSLPQLVAGQVLEVSREVECRVEMHPLGVVASIAPFNFPSMVPHWTIPNAIGLGNTFVLKPSELVPLSAVRIAELLAEAGLPDGVFNVVHGGRAVAEALCDHPEVRAVSFVGSTAVARAVYRRASANLKRVLALGGAKNHIIIMPDADPDVAPESVLAAMSGCTGQRCMAASVLVAVSTTDPLIERLVELTRAVVPGVHLGPLISRAAVERIEQYIAEAESEGARILVDGRRAVVPGKEGGYWVGPTIVDRVHPGMRIAREEVFGPVLVIVRAPDLDAALAVENGSEYGNAASVFTQSGGVARRVAARASAGMIGVNVGVPVPREPFSFGGWNDSKFGVGDITGPASLPFWTQSKKITSRWRPDSSATWMSR